MTDYISRDAAIESFRKNLDGGYVLTNDAQTTHILQSLPAADVVPMDFHERCLQIEIQKRMALERKRGKWRDGLSAYGTYTYKICSVCECVYIRKSNFCPNCGADMREKS